MTTKIVVIRGTTAGLTAAYLLQERYAGSLFEKDDRLGGHAHTLVVQEGLDAGTPLYIGFMVLNDRNYPTLHKLLARLGGIEIGNSEMSFSYYNETDDFHYALNFDPRHAFSQGAAAEPSAAQRNLLMLLKELLRFCRRASDDLEAGRIVGLSIGDYLDKSHCSQELMNRYLIPMAAGIWSTPPQSMRRFPDEALMGFYKNHGLLDLESPPQWQFIRGGSRRYVEAIVRDFKGSCAPAPKSSPLRVRRKAPE